MPSSLSTMLVIALFHSMGMSCAQRIWLYLVVISCFLVLVSSACAVLMATYITLSTFRFSIYHFVIY